MTDGAHDFYELHTNATRRGRAARPSCLTRAGLSRGAGQRDAATFPLPYVFVSPPSGCSILSSLSLPRRGSEVRAWGTV